MSIIKRAPVSVNPIDRHSGERRQSISGEWLFRLDPDDRGMTEKWYEYYHVFTSTIEVPGCWQGQGFGSDNHDFVWDFQLETRVFQATYQGTGWYARSFKVPAEWEGSAIRIHFGGVHPSADVWVNGVYAGDHHAPFVPFGFDISDVIRHGKMNNVVVRVHEQARELGLCYNWSGKWSGLYRDVELTATGRRFFESFRIYPDADTGKLTVRAMIAGQSKFRESGSPSGAPGSPSVELSVIPVNGGAAIAGGVIATGETGEFVCELEIPDYRRWCPETPVLYRVEAAITEGGEVSDALSERFGFVKLSTQGKHFLINNVPYYMRGTGDFHEIPETGCPDTNRDRWRKKLSALRQYGYNYVRCQSFVPTPEYMDVADEVGMLVQSEMGMLGALGGASKMHVYQWPQPTPDNREALALQWNQVVERDVNHPSANLYCMSNELGDHTAYPKAAWQCYRDTKRIKPTAFVIWTDGGYSESLPGEFVNAEARLDAECGKPVIQHEFRWWSSYPDVRSVHKFRGAVRPYGAEIALENAVRHGIGHVLAEAAYNSQRLQFIEAKGKMEACRRDNPTLAGICHFNAMDINASPQGIVDMFYERKFADSGTWLQTNGDTVVMSTLRFDDRVYVSGDTFQCELSVSDYSHPPMADPAIRWELLLPDGTIDASGSVEYRHIPYRTCPAGAVSFTVPAVAGPVKAVLQAFLVEEDRVFVNRWDLWFFPQAGDASIPVRLIGDAQDTWIRSVAEGNAEGNGLTVTAGGVKLALTERLTPETVSFIREGGTVVLAASEGLVRPFRAKLMLTEGRYFFTPPANYPPYEDGQNGTIVADHPMLGDFPHEGLADLHFYRMLGESAPIDLEPLGLNEGDPVIRMIHGYVVGRSLGCLAEYAIGQGTLIMSSLDLQPSYPEAVFLLRQLCRYALGDVRRPAARLDEDTIQKLVSATAFA